MLQYNCLNLSDMNMYAVYMHTYTHIIEDSIYKLIKSVNR